VIKDNILYDTEGTYKNAPDKIRKAAVSIKDKIMRNHVNARVSVSVLVKDDRYMIVATAYEAIGRSVLDKGDIDSLEVTIKDMNAKARIDEGKMDRRLLIETNIRSI